VATTAKWVAPETIASALTTELNALTAGSSCTPSAVIDNETDLFQYINLELVLASLTPTGTPSVDIYLLASLDSGTNYEDNSPSNGGSYLASFSFSTATAAKRCVLKNLVIPPLKFKLVALNNAGPSLAASGNTLKYRRHNEQGV
jgi:hypothetical protein